MPRRGRHLSEAGEAAHRAPGQHQKHYSPRTRVLLVNRGKLPNRGAGLIFGWSAIACGMVIRMPGEPEAYAAKLYGDFTSLIARDTTGSLWKCRQKPGMGCDSRPINPSGVLRGTGRYMRDRTRSCRPGTTSNEAVRYTMRHRNS